MYEKLYSKLKANTDLVTHEFYLNNKKINLIHNEVLCSSDFINHYILTKITNLSYSDDDIITFLYNNLPDNTVKVLTKEKEMLDYIYKGFALIIYQDEALAIEAKATLDRGINEANSEITIRGSKDSFNENFNTNIGLIRRRLRTENCYVESLFIGKESRCKTGIIYMKNIASLNTVKKVKDILSNIKIDDSEQTVKILGKGNKERILYLDAAVCEAIKAYLEIRPKIGKDNTDYDALFLSSRNKRISQRAVQVIIKDELNELFKDEDEDFKKKYHTHSLRHTGATLLYNENDISILIIQRILGHKQLSSTEIYTHVQNKQLFDSYMKFHPGEKGEKLK